MGRKPPSPAYVFTKECLAKDPGMKFEDIRALGEKQDLKIIPIIYGKAQKDLGHVESTPPGEKRSRTRKGKAGTEGEAMDLSSIEQMVSKFRVTCSENTAMKQGLREIQKILNQLL